MNTTTENKVIEFTRVNNDINGNPRYVCHFRDLLTSEEFLNTPKTPNILSHCNHLDSLYKMAVKRANKIGGRKFHNKQYGGGIVFQSYNIKETEKRIFELLETGK